MGRLTHRTSSGCTYFVTTKTWENRNLFQVTEISDIVLEVLFRHKAAGAYLLHEFVLTPDHLHLLLTPGKTTTLEKAVQLIKGGSSYEIHKRRQQRMEIWEPGFQDWTIRDEQDFLKKAEYIRMNPVTANLVTRPEDWLHSSAGGGLALDEMPETLSSGAKAQEKAKLNVGAKAPTL
jgi:putative transposase